jgi:hypothetical protein
MFEKKLLTLAGAAGILACGACFLPPLPPLPRPPRPPHIYLQGIQNIRVEAANVSPAHHLDPSGLAQAVANSIELRARDTGVNAFAQNEAGAGDAVLEITVLGESVTPSPTNGANISFLIDISATLTRQDGAVIWRETDARYPFSYSLTPDQSADAWQNASLRTWLTNVLGNRIVYRMFYGH